MIAAISDGLYAFLVTGGCFALVMLVLLIRSLRPAQLRSRRDQREVKRRVIEDLERRRDEQLERMRDTSGDGDDEAFSRYRALEHSIEIAKKI